MSGKLTLRAILFFCISIAASTTGMAKQQSSIDTGSFVFGDYKPFADRAIKVSYYYPQNKQNASILFVMHGNGREYQGYFKAMLKYAKKYNFILVVPEFDAKRFPTLDYHQGGLFKRDKTARDQKDWTFSIIEPLFDFVKQHAGNSSSGYYLYGFSAGSQFVHRYLMFTPENRVISAISGSAGTYTLPDYNTEYSYGLKNTNLPKANLEKFYAKDFKIIVGDADTVLSRTDLVKTPIANQQGRDRVERAYNFYKQSKEMATTLKTPFNWADVRLVKHAGHSQSAMAETVAKLLFEDK
jgi:predicted esterase